MNTDTAKASHKNPPAIFALTRVAVGSLSLGAAISALGICGLAIFAGAQPYWLLVGMELCIVLAGVFGLLVSTRKFVEGPAMAILCVAGTMFAAGFLSWLAVQRGMSLTGDRTVSLKLVMLARVAIAGVLVLLASVEVLRRSKASGTFLLRALLTGVPMCATAVGLYAGRDWIASQQSIPSWIVWTLVCVLVVVAMALLCACGHALIRAFEAGRTEEVAASPSSSA